MTIREGRLTLQPVSIARYESIIQQSHFHRAGPDARSTPSFKKWITISCKTGVAPPHATRDYW